jgi:hypothetical protein
MESNILKSYRRGCNLKKELRFPYICLDRGVEIDQVTFLNTVYKTLYKL